MKHSIFMKFLAIVLCAASLLGIAGGAAGALVLVENDLYNKTVDDVIAQRVQDLAVDAAHQVASRYADQILGGCPEEISRFSSRNLLSWNFTDYGYAIIDSNGNVLESLNPELKDQTQTHSIPVTGQYMHLVSTETEAQRLASETAAKMEYIGRVMTDSDGETLPEGGTTISQVIFTDLQGAPVYEAFGDPSNCYSIFYYGDSGSHASSNYEHVPQSNIGFLYYGPQGQLIYQSFLEENESHFPPTEIFGVMFLSYQNDFMFQLQEQTPLGKLSFADGSVRFAGYPPAAEESAPQDPEPVPTAIPEESTAAEVPTESLEAQPSIETEPTEAYTEEAPTQETYVEESQDVSESDEEAADEEETEGEPSSASADPDEEEDASQEEIDWEHYDYKAQERITYEWLLANGLIADTDLPEDMLSDEDLHYWLVEYDLIDKHQEIPRKKDTLPASVPAETQPEEILLEETLPPETIPEETRPQITEPVLINGKPLETYQVNRTEYVDHNTGEHTTAKYVYLPMPELTVEVYAGTESITDVSSYDVLRVLRQYRSILLPVIGASLLLFALSAVYLCTAAGRQRGSSELRAGGLNRLPLDLYLLLSICAGVGLIGLILTGTSTLLQSDFILGCSFAVAAGFGCCLLFVGFCFAFVAQGKTGSGFWWRNTLSVRLILLFMRFAEKFRLWMAGTGLPGLSQFVRKTWQKIWRLLALLYTFVEKTTRRTGEKLNRFFSLIPMTWQWLLGGLAIILFALLVNTHHILLILLGILVPMAIVLYATHCFGLLSESAKRMGKGDLDTKVEDKFMVGCFKNFAGDLNDLADVAMVAAQKQLKSERMKTELITNVSHDIKTPLTSIINYVDLLQKPHNDTEEAEYLEVLDRQSQRLKKLVDDLMDMSKASTGNMAVEITRVDAVESINQALGEFADKLERAQLYPVFRHSEESVPVMADGKLVWRVLSNLLSNTVKYALPGTRIYLDLSHVNGKVIISMKNISRKELNIDAEELMERFVRGDISRNTEGSGLGLNIAKSLMELQKGSLQILVDGDLFKVTLIFPDAK